MFLLIVTKGNNIEISRNKLKRLKTKGKYFLEAAINRDLEEIHYNCI